MFVVGITGGIGSGKSAVTAKLEQLGIDIIDTDIVAREVVEPGTKALKDIQSYFGDRVLSSDGALDRAALREIVFSEPEKRKWLEALLHPIIRNETIKQLNNTSSPYAVLASPLLLETDQHELTQHIVLIDVSVETQIERTIARDNNNRKQVEAIIAAQMSRTEKQRKSDIIVTNDEDLSALYNKVSVLHETLKRLALQEIKS